MTPTSSCHRVYTCIFLPQERVIDRLEGQRQEHAIHLYHAQADELDRWLARMRSAAVSVLDFKPSEDADVEDQLGECQVGAPRAGSHSTCVISGS